MSRVTRWGREILAAGADVVPLPEYPRPQLVRDEWLNLNGRWDFAVTESARPPVAFEQQILVPFAPESTLSGIGRITRRGEHVWYRRRVSAPAPSAVGGGTGRVLLHFGAVDQRCDVLIDGRRVGGHVGGYLPFTLDVTEALGDGGSHELLVHVEDGTETSYHAVGKQRLRRGGIWYTPHSGIWQTVWLERVPTTRVVAVDHVADLAAGTLTISVRTSAPAGVDVEGLGSAASARTRTATGEDRHEVTVVLEVGDADRWTPEDPKLHEVVVRTGDDVVRCPVALREVGMGVDADGRPLLTLNGEPFLHAGVLDQGYWPESLVTPPSDEAMVCDIQTMKDAGFTVLRKHIKVEPARWYHHCDRLGMLVWQDMVNGGRPLAEVLAKAPVAVQLPLRDRCYGVFGRRDAAGRAEFLRELEETITLLRCHPSVVVWVPFNEGWGQFDAAAVAKRVKELDPTRLVDHASGWYDQGGGDIDSRHVYFKPIPRRGWGRGTRASVVTEYGGYVLRLPGHEFSAKDYGYGTRRTRAALTASFEALHERQVAPAIRAGLSGFVYTQLSDVEDELNGLLTADRSVAKIGIDDLARVNAALRHAFDSRFGAGYSGTETKQKG